MPTTITVISRLFIFFILLCSTTNLVQAQTKIQPNAEISIEKNKSTSHFSTWQGIEPDKWATLWLIKRYLSQDAYFTLVPPNSKLPEASIKFGIPNATIYRANRASMFRRLKQALAKQEEIQSLEINYIDKIIHDVEVNIWDNPSHPHSLWFETMYRQLQARYQRNQVPIDCYLTFFDRVAIIAQQKNVVAKDYSEQLALIDECPGLTVQQSLSKRITTEDSIVATGHLEVLREIALGKKIIFIDTRETNEYNEVHLPGAQILRLREVDEASINAFSHADLVIPYCVKDFRGFEVALAIKRLGFNRVATLSPNGLKGWLKAGLPIVKEGEHNEKDAIEELRLCAAEPYLCINDMESS